MARPRRSIAESFYDVFSDFPISEQVIALRICQELHRQAIKLVNATPTKRDAVASAAGSLACGFCRMIGEHASNCPKVLQGSLLDDTESGNGGSKLQ